MYRALCLVLVFAVSTLCVLGTRDNPFIWQAVVEYDSVSERNYVAGSSLKQYSQDFQTLVVHNDLHGYSQRLLLDLGHGCNGTTTIDNLKSWNGNISSSLLSIPSIALVERGDNCHLWSHKINNALALSSQHNLNITAILIADNTTYDDANAISLPTTANNPPIWNTTTLPPIRNATLMPDNDIDSATINIHAAVYFTPALYAAELKAMIRKYNNDVRRYVQLRMLFEETSFLVNTTSGDTESQDDSDDGEGSNNADRGYLAYVIAAATTLVFVGMVCLRWCRKSRDDESAIDTAGAVLGQNQQETRRLSITVLNNLCPVQELHKVDTKNTVCAVCLDELKENDLVRILPCNHGFCVACIDLWLTKKSSLCPICKYDCDPNHQPQRSSSEHVTEEEDSPSSPAQQQQPLPPPSTSETTVELQQVRVTRPTPPPPAVTTSS